MFETKADLKLKEHLEGESYNVVGMGVDHELEKEDLVSYDPIIIGGEDSSQAGKTLRDALLHASSEKGIVVYDGHQRMGKSCAYDLAAISEAARKAGISMSHLCEMTENSKLSLKELSGKLSELASSGLEKKGMEKLLVKNVCEPKYIDHYEGWGSKGESNSTKRGFNQNEISRRRKKNKIAKKNKRKNR